jgi:hypothetical protein
MEVGDLQKLYCVVKTVGSLPPLRDFSGGGQGRGHRPELRRDEPAEARASSSFTSLSSRIIKSILSLIRVLIQTERYSSRMEEKTWPGSTRSDMWFSM